jgi:hypothetical protein
MAGNPDLYELSKRFLGCLCSLALADRGVIARIGPDKRRSIQNWCCARGIANPEATHEPRRHAACFDGFAFLPKSQSSQAKPVRTPTPANSLTR